MSRKKLRSSVFRYGVLSSIALLGSFLDTSEKPIIKRFHGSVLFAAIGTNVHAGELRQISWQELSTHAHLVFPVEVDMSYRIEPIFEAGNQKFEGSRKQNARHGTKESFVSSRIADSKETIGFQITFTNTKGSELEKMLRQSPMLNSARNQKYIQKINAAVNDNEIRLTVLFTALSSKNSFEYFDYRVHRDHEVVLDVWDAANSVSAKAPLNRSVAANTENKTKILPKTRPSTSVSLPLAELHGVGQCPHPIQLENEGILHWSVSHDSFDYVKFLKQPFPDSNFHYSEPALDSDDQVHFRLARKLYEENRFGMALKTIEFFEKKKFATNIVVEMQFLKANILLKLAEQLNTERFRDQANGILDLLSSTHKETAIGKNARIFRLQHLAKQNQWLPLLELSLEGIEIHDEHEPMYRLAAAESYQAIGDTKKAAEYYSSLESTAASAVNFSVEGAFRLGEIYFLERNFQKAIDSFVTARKKYKEKLSLFPSSQFNLAEAYFRNGDLANAREAYLEFIKNFDTHQNAWAAELRIAEVSNVIGVRGNSEKRSDGDRIKKYYEAIVNRHPYSPGATLAYLRLTNCLNQKAPKSEQQLFVGFYNKIDENSVKDKLISPIEFKRWLNLSQIKFYRFTKQYERILPLAKEYRGRFSDITLGQAIKNEISKGIYEYIVDLVRDNSQLALAMHDEYGDYVKGIADSRYLVALYRAAQKTGDLVKEVKYLDLAENSLMSNSDRSSIVMDEFYLLKAATLKKTKKDCTEIVQVLQKISDHKDYSYQKLSQLSLCMSEQKEYSQSLQYDKNLLTLLPMQGKPRSETFSRMIKSLWHLNECSELVKEAGRFILTDSLSESAQGSLPQIKEYRAECLFKLKNYRQALMAYEELIEEQATSQSTEKNSLDNKLWELSYRKAECLSNLDKKKESLEVFRKVASSDKGYWGKSAEQKIEQANYEEKSQK